MNLTIQASDGQGGWLPAADVGSINEVFDAVLDHCEHALYEEPTFAACLTASDGCAAEAVCKSQLHLCELLTFREMATGVGAMVLVDDAGNDAFRVPHQDAESQVALEQFAMIASMNVLLATGAGLREDLDLESEVCSDTRLLEPVGLHESIGGQTLLEQSVGELLSATMVEGLRLGEAAAHNGARLAVAIADRDRTAISNPGRASRLSWFDSNLSRVSAVQMLTGGMGMGTSPFAPMGSGGFTQDPAEPSYQDLTRTGIGSQRPCVGPCETALRLLRLSGAPFDEIVGDPEEMGTPSTDQLVTEEVSGRLAERLANDALDGMDAEQLAEHFDITPNALEEARAWMRHEAAVFARPGSLPDGTPLPTADPPPLAPAQNGTPRESAFAYHDPTTLSEPTPPSPLRFITAARAPSLWGESGPQPADPSMGDPAPPWNRPEAAYLFDQAHTAARAVIAEDRVDDDAAGILATLVQDGFARNAARTEACVRDNNGDEYRIRLYSDDPGSSVLVDNLIDLQCLTAGRLEGRDCAAPTANTGTCASLPDNLTTGWRDYCEWVESEPTSGSTTFYVLRLKPHREHGPGAYEVVAGGSFTADASASGTYDRCTTMPFDGPNIRKSGSYSEPDPEAPSLEPSSYCGNYPFGPIPLEDEIIDDGDLYEDSWEHHLRSAQRAADHADALGQEVLRSGLEIDQRAEQSLLELEELCGATVNVDNLFGGAGDLGEVNLENLIDSTITDCPTTECAAGYTCVGTRCVAEFLVPTGANQFEVEALASCLGLELTGTTGDMHYTVGRDIDVVALGSTPLCLWYNPAAPSVLCEGATADTCPIEAPADLNCAAAVDNPVGTTPLLVTHGAAGDPSVDTLDLFSTLSPHGEIAAAARSLDPPCDQLRGIRAAISAEYTEGFFNYLVETGFFGYENVRFWAGRIGWNGLPLNYSEYTLDGQPWLTPDATGPSPTATGYPFGDDGSGRIAGSETNHWPCDRDLVGASCLPGALEGLFCDHVDCSDEVERASFNRRMGRAAATLAGFSGVGLANIHLPAFYVEDDIGAPVADLEVNLGSTRTVHDHLGRPWLISNSASPDGNNWRSGLFVVPPPGVTVWTSAASVGTQNHVLGSTQEGISTLRPFGFVNFGVQYRDDNEHRATQIGRSLWAGLSPESLGTATESANHSFFGAVAPPNDTVAGRSIFRRALLFNDPMSTQYVNGRATVDTWTDWGAGVAQLTHLFGNEPFDFGELKRFTNHAHLFEDNHDSGFLPAIEQGVGGSRLRRRDLLDAMELMCQVAASDSAGGVPDCDVPPPITSMADVGRLQSYMRCMAIRLEMLSARQVVQGIPADVVGSLRGEPGDTRPDAGQYGEVITQLRTTLRGQAQAPRQIASIFRDMADDIELLKSQQASLKIEETLTWLRATASALGAAQSCAGGASGSGGATCVIAAAQVALAIGTAVVEADGISESSRQQLIQFRTRMGQRADALMALEDELGNGTDSVAQLLARLEVIRASARSALTRATFMESDAAGRHYAVNTAMRRLYDVDLYRYRQAHQASIIAARVARAAIEQRFGVDLSTISCAGLVDPPDTWANDVCSASGVNYADLRDPDDELYDAEIRQMFVGDYVRRLEQWVESYRFDFPYTSADDSTVMSLRDDFARPSGSCVAASENLLGMSNALNAPTLPLPNGAASTEASEPAWGLPPGACVDADSSGTIDNCVSVSPVTGPGARGIHIPHGFRVAFAPGAPGSAGYVSEYSDAAEWTQTVVLGAGVYQLSWYQVADINTEAIVWAVSNDVAITENSEVFVAAPEHDEILNDGWERRFWFFRVPATAAGAAVRVGVLPELMSGSVHEQVIQVAGFQLTDVSSTVGRASNWSTIEQAGVDLDRGRFYPQLFVATTAPGNALFSGSCLTDDPVAFREDAWVYRCDRLCAGGFDRCGPSEIGELFCYWESSFTITEEMLQSRTSGFSGGFAFGNYNYRTGNIALNVVGTGVLDCGGPDARSCLATASIPYSIEHHPIGDDSAYPVTTHSSTDPFPANLFLGRIESARALTAERYLTNPLSGSDRSLIQDYWRGEFRGRPMPGRYVIRIWDVPGLRFSSIEDVQLIWNYRYFTRTSEARCDSTWSLGVTDDE